MTTALASDAVSPPPVAADALARALVAASDAPIVLLDGDLTVVAASGSFARAFQIDPDAMGGRPMLSLGAGEWDVPQLSSLFRLTLFGATDLGPHEMDLIRADRKARRLVITAHRLDHSDTHDPRLLVEVSDVTDARLAERVNGDLLREKALLYQELQHRVANSLQIIASVLMQSARRVPSARVRSHLYAAHSRVMSVATLQQHLTASPSGEVRLREYFTELCRCIGDSMIDDRDKLTLKVEVDEGVAMPDVSISLGLIVTELVINALKHAFPLDVGGDILISYRSSATGWMLSVSDNGVGMPSGSAAPNAGLGTSIVEALARQLQADVHHADNYPGAIVSIVHEEAPAVSDHSNKPTAPQKTETARPKPGRPLHVGQVAVRQPIRVSARPLDTRPIP